MFSQSTTLLDTAIANRINYSTLRHRLKSGMKLDEALAKPVNHAMDSSERREDRILREHGETAEVLIRRWRRQRVTTVVIADRLGVTKAWVDAFTKTKNIPGIRNFKPPRFTLAQRERLLDTIPNDTARNTTLTWRQRVWRSRNGVRRLMCKYIGPEWYLDFEITADQGFFKIAARTDR